MADGGSDKALSVIVVGALIADAAGQPTRRDGLPQPEDEVFVYFAVTPDGLEIAITADEIAGSQR